jgi:hypothetical protein
VYNDNANGGERIWAKQTHGDAVHLDGCDCPFPVRREGVQVAQLGTTLAKPVPLAGGPALNNYANYININIKHYNLYNQYIPFMYPLTEQGMFLLWKRENKREYM